MLNDLCQGIIWITILWMMNAMIFVAQGKLWRFTIDTITALSSDHLAQMYVVALAFFPRQLKVKINNKNTASSNGTCQK